ncbi:MAG TPA: serine hydrolase domain-containing protein [Blastocatellia bacterium]|nr:serine hydrolase domain-containing protein [Blastocatellia bacterium]
MKPRLLTIALATALFSGLLLAAVDSPQLAQTASLADRIGRIENGLAPEVLVKGQPEIRMKLADRMKHYNVPGLSVAFINNHQIEWAKGYGVLEAGTSAPVTAETLFQAASISKPVAAMGALYLVQQGKLDLDEDVNKKLASWKVPESDFTKQKSVTLRGLLSHNAGLTVHGFRGYAEGEPVPTVVQILNGQPPANSAAIKTDILPGSRWRYSGGGYTVMQQLVADVTGKPFPRFMQETVFARLDMKQSTYEQPLPDKLKAKAAVGHNRKGEPIKGKYHTYPELAAAGLWTTPSDLARFAIELQKARIGKSSRVLNQNMVNQMLTVQAGSYGLGLGIEGKDATATFSHGGSNVGFKCILTAYMDSGQGFVIMTNGDNGPQLAGEIIRSAAREYGWSDRAPVVRELATVDPKSYEAIVGKYDLSGVKATVVIENGKPFILVPDVGIAKAELLPQSDTKYFILENNITFTFIKDEKGVVTEIIAQPGGRTIKGKREN